MCFVHKTADNNLIRVSFSPSLSRDLVVIHVRLLDNEAKVHKEERQIIRLQEGIKHLKKTLLFVFFCACPWFICCFLVLGYLSDSKRGKTAEYLRVHHCTSSECTISRTEEDY